ncbi:MAG: prolyl oligopeptidase family serine peptidase [Spirochaetales bacterium]|nr:prolyl oligopeptidase family serine peptidase [Spirochaetales bacterium]
MFLQAFRSTSSAHEIKGFVRSGILSVLFWLSTSCMPLDHFLVHPQDVPSTVVTWNEEVQRGSLLLHLEWARPAGDGPFPGVLVHPEAGKKAHHMLGVIWDLAQHGYIAVAVDYRRMIRGEYRETLFPWREEGDVAVAFNVLRSNAFVDQKRVGALGFSQGGVFSLLIASSAGSGIKSVVAYYPITDFSYWLDETHYQDKLQKFICRRIRSYFRMQSDAGTDEEFQAMLRRASPIFHTETLTASVLLIHGESDTTAPVEESRRLYARLHEMGRKVELLVIPNAVHVFNFRNREQAAVAWEATLRWLDEELKPEL